MRTTPFSRIIVGDSSHEMEATMIDHVSSQRQRLRSGQKLLLGGARAAGLLASPSTTDEFAGFADAHGIQLRRLPPRSRRRGPHRLQVRRPRALVDGFHGAALAAGATDNGSPGLRPHYHENYYGAFVRDADGNNIEAVCQTPA